MRHAPFLLALLLLAPPTARADDAAGDDGSTDYGEGSTDANPYAADPAPLAAPPEEAEAAPEAAPEEESPKPSRRSRRENRVKDHAIGVGYYYTHMQWDDFETGATPQVDYHAMAIRYAYYVGQAQRFGFLINAAATIPMYLNQSGVQSDISTNGSYNLLSTYDRHVGFDISFMAGTHRMLTERLAAIAGLGMHVGILKLNSDELAIHEYIALGAAGVFSLRYHVSDIFTVGCDVNASLDFRDAVHHVSPLDYALNLGLTANVGLSF